MSVFEEITSRNFYLVFIFIGGVDVIKYVANVGNILYSLHSFFVVVKFVFIVYAVAVGEHEINILTVFFFLFKIARRIY